MKYDEHEIGKLIKQEARVGQEARLRISGLPVVSFEFMGLPSVNTHYNKHFRPRSVETAEWRYEAKQKALEHTLWLDDYLIRRALVVVNFYPPAEEISDVHNVYIKALLDGFSSAELWRDDEWAFVPLVLFAYAGPGEHKPRQNRIRRTRLDIYELQAYIVNGDTQILPRGRKWLPK